MDQYDCLAPSQIPYSENADLSVWLSVSCFEILVESQILQSNKMYSGIQFQNWIPEISYGILSYI